MMLSALLLLGGALGAALAVQAAWIEPRSLRVTRATVVSPTWPATAPSLRLALIADPQAAGPHATPARFERVVTMTNAERPDLILLLGDYIATKSIRTSFVPPEATARVFARLEAPLGTYAVLGNHDWCFGGARVRAAFETVGIPVLENEARRLSGLDHDLWLAGVGDVYVRRHDLTGTLRQITDDAPIVLMTHSPDLFPRVPPEVALTVAGHTHGGQIRLPLVGRAVVPSDYGQRYAYGHIVENDRHLFVSSGVGHSVLPVRFGVPPEIALITLCGSTNQLGAAIQPAATAATDAPSLVASKASSVRTPVHTSTP